MKDLYWKVLEHVHGSGHWGSTGAERADAILAARRKVEVMSPLELLEAISAVFEQEAES